MNKYEIAIKKIKKCVEYAYQGTYDDELKVLQELVENSKWHKYPDDKPKEDGVYIVVVKEFVERKVTCDDYIKGEFMRDNVIEWKELPEYEEEE